MTRPYVAIRSGEPLHRRSFDVLVLGGGIAGLTAAIGAARRWHVGLLTKSTFEETTTFLAQGGIAAAIGEEDSPELHFQDTIGAGAGLCDEEAVRVLVNEGPDRVRELMEICPRFDKVDGQIVLGREGAHSLPRIVHAGGDATGSEVSSALAEAARVGSRVQLYEDEFVIDLLTVDGRCVGALTLNLADGGLTLNVAMVTVLATGGAGQVYGRTTNPPVATGDGVAMAYRAGAAIRDLEFVQFHPTGLAVPGQQTVQLITEALRGEGAYLRNAAGERFMTEYDSRAELASRDIVVRGMVAEMRREGTDHVYLDATHLDATWLAERFPSVTGGLREHGLDLATQLIPVAPVCHYFVGGVVTDVWGRTTVPGLYASGEVASTGVHGANRLASNSLLEGLVFSDRVVRDLDRYIGKLGEDVRRLSFDIPEEEPGRRGQRRRRGAHPSHRRHAAQGRRAAPRGRPAGGAGRAERPHVRAALLAAGRGRVRGAQHAHAGDADRQVRAAARGVARRAPSRRLPGPGRRALAQAHHAASAGAGPGRRHPRAGR